MPTSLSPALLCLTLSAALILTLNAQPAHQTLDLLSKEHARCKSSARNDQPHRMAGH